MSDQMRRTVYAVLDMNRGMETGELESFIEEYLEKICLATEKVHVHALPRLMSLAELDRIYGYIEEAIEVVKEGERSVKRLNSGMDKVSSTITSACNEAKTAIGGIGLLVRKELQDGFEKEYAKLEKLFQDIHQLKKNKAELQARVSELKAKDELQKQVASLEKEVVKLEKMVENFKKKAPGVEQP